MIHNLYNEEFELSKGSSSICPHLLQVTPLPLNVVCDRPVLAYSRTLSHTEWS